MTKITDERLDALLKEAKTQSDRECTHPEMGKLIWANKCRPEVVIALIEELKKNRNLNGMVGVTGNLGAQG